MAASARLGPTTTVAGIVMRVPEKPIRRYPWYLRPFFWNQKRKYGQVLGAITQLPSPISTVRHLRRKET